MQTLKRGLAMLALLFSPLTLAQDLNAQLNDWFGQRLAGFSDDVVVTVRTPPNLLPHCDTPAFSMTGAKLWGNVNVLARCANEKRYLQVNVQATGNYVVAAASVARGGTLGPASVTLKRGRLDQLPPPYRAGYQPGSGCGEPARSRAGTGHPAQYVAPGVAH